MSVQRHGGTTPLDRFRSRLDADTTCPSCGYEDETNRWRARTTGDRIDYTHLCPVCGAVDRRTLKLK